MNPELSVLLTARDEAEQLGSALASVAGWASEVIVVVDPRTVDATRDVARRVGSRVLEHPFESSAAQCNWGLEECSRSWVLVLDADERVTPALRTEIDRLLPAAAAQAYSVRRVNFAFGRPLRWGEWGKDRVVRLLRRGRVQFEPRAVHGAAVASSVERLSGALEHHTLRSLGQYLPKLEDYASRGASDLLAGGRTPTPARALVHAGWRLVRGAVLRLGFLDGWPGLATCCLAAWGTWLKWMLAWERTTADRRRP